MTTAEEVHALASWHAPAVSGAADPTRLRLSSTGYAVLLKLRRVRH
jgi:hypothetical protein